LVFIVNNFSTNFTMSPELEKDIYNIDGLPYCPPKKNKDTE
jgi:hypothetical protein